MPSVPNNVTITSGNNSLTVVWLPPDVLNAPSVNYSLLYSIVNSSSVPRAAVASDTMVLIDGLEAFTEYSVAIQACSVAGCGPFTLEVTERTQERRTYVTGRLTNAMYICSSLDAYMYIQLAWLGGGGGLQLCQV